MFEEFNRYKSNGNLSFKQGYNLRETSRDDPNLPGVYYIICLSKAKPKLVYIGKAGSMAQNGLFKN